ncbi:MAG: tetratricopeptide repeat protein [Candidatus Melainabacteria bacterium]|nr:tetratricopeptide repeat protein [Candidatus Melainabacteria bacterium]
MRKLLLIAASVTILGTTSSAKVLAYVDPAFDRGKALMASGEWDQAATAFGESLGLNATDPNALSLRGQCFYKMGNYKLAIQDLDSSLQYAPNNLKGLLLRGTCHSILGHDAMAIIDYEAAIRMDPSLAQRYFASAKKEVPHSDLGTKAEGGQGHTEAVQDYKEAMNNVYPNGYKDSNSSDNTPGWTGALGSGKPEKSTATGGSEISVSNQPGSVGATQAISPPGRAGTGMTNNDNGMPYINSDAQNNAAVESKDTIPATKDKRFVTPLDQDPNRGEIGKLAGTGEFEGDPKKAIIDYNQALGLDPTNGEYYFRRAKAYQKLNKVNEAMGDFESAISQAPNNARYYLGRASLFYQLGKTVLLQADIESARNCDPDLPAKIHFYVPALPKGTKWAGDGAN